MKSSLIFFLLLILYSCGGGGAGGGGKTGASETPSSVETIQTSIVEEAQWLEEIWDRFKESDKAAWSAENEFQAGIVLGQIIAEADPNYSLEAASLVFEAFRDASVQHTRPDFLKVARTTTKENLK